MDINRFCLHKDIIRRKSHRGPFGIFDPEKDQFGDPVDKFNPVIIKSLSLCLEMNIVIKEDTVGGHSQVRGEEKACSHLFILTEDLKGSPVRDKSLYSYKEKKEAKN
jgi:hypothetical protein